MFRETRTTSARVIVQFVETMTGIRAVKAFRKEKRNEKEFAGLVEDYRDANMRAINLFGVYDPALVLIGNVTLAVVLLVGGLRVAEGDLAIGCAARRPAVHALLLRPGGGDRDVLQLLPVGVGRAGEDLRRARGAAERARPDADRSTSGRRRARWLSTTCEFAYKTDRVVLPTFDLDIPAGQTIALVGSTGAGKSTLAKLISRFYDPTAGSVSLDGVDLRQLHPKDLRRAIVMVTQEAYLFSGTVADNIALGKPEATRERDRRGGQGGGRARVHRGRCRTATTPT